MMEVKVQHGPGGAAARVCLAANESLTSEAGSMIAMTDGIQVTSTTHKKGGGAILKALGRKLAGETFFLNHFTAGRDGGDVWVAPALTGDVICTELQGSSLV